MVLGQFRLPTSPLPSIAQLTTNETNKMQLDSSASIFGNSTINNTNNNGSSSSTFSTAAGGDEEDQLSLAERSLLQKMIRKTLVTDKSQIEVKQKDPTSPLYSLKSFEELNLRPELLKGIYAMGFSLPSRIQETALPFIIQQDTNLIAQSQSGTGKTAAFVLAMLSKVKPTIQETQILLLAPTLELALQIGSVIGEMGKYCQEISVLMAVAGEKVYDNVNAHIVIGTPGKIMDLAFRSRRLNISTITMLVLDEADVMLNTQGYHDQCIKLVRRLPATTQRLLFSATYSYEVMKFAEQIVPDATIIRLKREEESLDNIKHFYIKCQDAEGKYKAIANIYGAISIGQAMIFTQTRVSANKLYTSLTRDGHAVALLSGELSVEERINILNRFRDGLEKILIATNVVARGIDIEKVTLCINYDLPLTYPDYEADCETYLHRVGRTGRFGKAGIAINFVSSQRDMEILDRIRRHFGKPIIELNPENIEELEKLEQ